MKKIPVFCAVLALAILLLGGCDLELSDEGPQADGIVIYTGREILNNQVDFPIVAKRLQQLYATSPSGRKVVWESSDPVVMEIDPDTGYLQVGQALGKRATISASLKDDPSIRAEVIFIVRDLR